jgi:hypothetical protein
MMIGKTMPMVRLPSLYRRKKQTPAKTHKSAARNAPDEASWFFPYAKLLMTNMIPVMAGRYIKDKVLIPRRYLARLKLHDLLLAIPSASWRPASASAAACPKAWMRVRTGVDIHSVAVGVRTRVLRLQEQMDHGGRLPGARQSSKWQKMAASLKYESLNSSSPARGFRR